jgi:hypothetical protein
MVSHPDEVLNFITTAAVEAVQDLQLSFSG